MDEKKKVYALYFGMRSVEPAHGLDAGHAKFSVVEIRDNGEIRNPETGNAFDDLNFRCQWNEKLSEEPYAFELEYDGGFIDLPKAETMVRLLRRARKIEDRFPVRPETFGQWCVLMARGLGITKLVRFMGGNGLSFADNEHRTFVLKEAQYVIDRAIADCRQERSVVA